MQKDLLFISKKKGVSILSYFIKSSIDECKKSGTDCLSDYTIASLLWVYNFDSK